MRYDLAIFDMDGTILDTLGDLRDSLNAALASEGLPPRTTDEARRFVGNGIRRLVERGVPDGTPDEVLERVLVAFKRHYAVHCADSTCPYPGIPEMLSSLRAAGVRTAVVSNKDDGAVRRLAETFFPGAFDHVAGLREGVRRKPAPDTVDAAIASLGVRRSSAVYIGDSEVDLETARAARIPCITVLWGFRSREELAAQGSDCFAAGPADELRLILE